MNRERYGDQAREQEYMGNKAGIVRDHLERKFDHIYSCLDEIEIPPRKRKCSTSEPDRAPTKKRRTRKPLSQANPQSRKKRSPASGTKRTTEKKRQAENARSLPQAAVVTPVVSVMTTLDSTTPAPIVPVAPKMPASIATTPPTTLPSFATPVATAPTTAARPKNKVIGGFLRTIETQATQPRKTITREAKVTNYTSDLHKESLHGTPATEGLSAFDALGVKNRWAKKTGREKRHESANK